MIPADNLVEAHERVIVHLKRALEQSKRHEFTLSRKSILLALVASELAVKAARR
jgi:hypothetical protein